MRRRWFLVVVALWVMLVSGCGAAPSNAGAPRPATPAGLAHVTSAGSPHTSATGAASEGPSASGARSSPTPPPDGTGSTAPAALRELLTAPVPSMCGHPAGRLVDGALPGIARYRGYVHLFTGTKPDDRVAPVRVDLTGDGTDIAAVASCSQGGVAWPEWVLLYSEKPRLHLIGQFDLGSIAATEHATVSGLVVSGDAVQVQWGTTDGCCTNPQEWSATLTSNGSKATVTRVTQVGGAPGRTVDVQSIPGGIAGFATPSGNITCMIMVEAKGRDPSVRCDIREFTWSLTRPSSCPLAYGQTFLLSERARLGCVGDTVEGVAAPGTPETSWRVRGLDATISVPSGRAVTLGYGSAMEAGDLVCRSRRTALTCTNDRTHASFTLARNDYTITNR